MSTKLGFSCIAASVSCWNHEFFLCVRSPAFWPSPVLWSGVSVSTLTRSLFRLYNKEESILVSSQDMFDSLGCNLLIFLPSLCSPSTCPLCFTITKWANHEEIPFKNSWFQQSSTLTSFQNSWSVLPFKNLETRTLANPNPSAPFRRVCN